MLRFSLFDEYNGTTGIWQTTPTKTLNFKQLIEYYNSDKNKSLSKAIHNASTQDEKKRLKNKRAYFTASGTFTAPRSNKNILQHNNVISIDIDNLKSIEQAKQIRNQLAQHKSVLFSLLSVRQKGVKALMLVNGTYTPEEQYQQLKHIFKPYLAGWLNIDAEHIDNAQFKLSQPCFFSYDVEMYVNENAQPLELEFNYTAPERSTALKRNEITGNYESTCVPIDAKTRIESYLLAILNSKLALLTPTGARHPKLANAKLLGQLIHYAPHLETHIIDSFIDAGVQMYNNEKMRSNVTKSVNAAFNDGVNDSILYSDIETIIKDTEELKKNDKLQFPYGLDFHNKPNEDYSYCPLFYKELDITYYRDNAKGTPFKANRFLLWEQKFNVIAANSNFNAPAIEEKRWRQMNAEEFTKKLKRSYLMLKYLNNSKDKAVVNEAFKTALKRLSWRANNTFNVEYVVCVLVPKWDKVKIDVSRLITQRNWRIHTNDVIKTTHDFQTYLNEDNKLHKVNFHLKYLLELVDRQEYIEPKEIGLRFRDSEPYTWDLMKQYNETIIGCKTLKEYNNIQDLNNWINDYIKVKVQNSHSTCYTYTMGCVINVLKHKQHRLSLVLDNEETVLLPNYKTLIENVGCSRRNIKHYLTFERKENALEDFKSEVIYRLNNPHSFTFERIIKRLCVVALEHPTEIDIKESFEAPVIPIHRPMVKEQNAPEEDLFTDIVDITNIFGAGHDKIELCYTLNTNKREKYRKKKLSKPIDTNYTHKSTA